MRDDPHVHMQRVEQVKDMSAAARTALGMSYDDILAVEIGRTDVGSADQRMGFRECSQPFLGPYGIADDRRSFDRRKHQAEVDPAALQGPALAPQPEAPAGRDEPPATTLDTP